MTTRAKTTATMSSTKKKKTQPKKGRKHTSWTGGRWIGRADDRKKPAKSVPAPSYHLVSEITIAGRIQLWSDTRAIEHADHWPAVLLFAARGVHGFNVEQVSSDAVSGLRFVYRPTERETGDPFAALPGQLGFKRALEIAAAGGHPVFAWLSPGVGREDVEALAESMGVSLTSARRCPCGNLGSFRQECSCSLEEVKKHCNSVARPLRRTAEIEVALDPVCGRFYGVESEGWHRVWERITAASNRVRVSMSEPGEELIRSAVDRMSMGVREAVKVRRVAETVARLARAEIVAPAHVAEALQYRVPYW